MENIIKGFKKIRDSRTKGITATGCVIAKSGSDPRHSSIPVLLEEGKEVWIIQKRLEKSWVKEKGRKPKHKHILPEAVTRNGEPSKGRGGGDEGGQTDGHSV